MNQDDFSLFVVRIFYSELQNSPVRKFRKLFFVKFIIFAGASGRGGSKEVGEAAGRVGEG